MFDTVQTAPPDAILGLTEAFLQDARPGKVNLSVGVYQDESGRTPILECVHAAEQRLLNEEATKNYLGIGGLPPFAQQVPALVLGSDSRVLAERRVATVQTPGGTGALRVAADFLARNFPAARAWCSRPTWANHPSIFQAAGMEVGSYPYVNSTGTELDRAAFLEGLESIPRGDVVCLHACCHNPTGVDPDLETWREVAQIARRKQWLPLLDFAYQGFGDGLEEDAASVRALIEAGNEAFVASSFSKNFGLYGERVGALTAVASTPEAAAATLSQIKVSIRANYSNPPKHGAAIVVEVLRDPQLRELWQRELAAMRERIQLLRDQLVTALEARGVDRDFSFIRRQRGMFSYSGLSPLQVDQLRNEFGIYIVGSGRINVAGLNASNLDAVCDAMAAVCR